MHHIRIVEWKGFEPLKGLSPQLIYSQPPLAARVTTPTSCERGIRTPQTARGSLLTTHLNRAMLCQLSYLTPSPINRASTGTWI